VQRELFDMIRSQQKPIDTLKQMLAQLLKKKTKKPKAKGSFSKGKEKEVENSTSERTENENNSDFEPSKCSSKEEGSSRNGDNHSKRMNELEKHLEAIANRSNLQEAGIIRPYPAEWDVAPYLPKFKAPTLHTFNSKGSPNHIYYFKSQTRKVVLNDAIMVRLFIGTLKGVAFEWFMKLPASSIKTWAASRNCFWLVSLKTIQKSQSRLSLLQSRSKENLLRHSSRDSGAWHSNVLAA